MPHQTLSLSQQQRQMMILAPQLRQSLEMLQMPILELRAMIQQEMELNPTIEDVISRDVSVDAETPRDAGEPDPEHTTELNFDKEFEVLAEIDDEWRDYFFQNLQNTGYNPDEAEKHQFMLDSIRQPESLQEHLIEQLNLTDLEEADRQLGLMIIGSLNDDGYLDSALDLLARQINTTTDHLAEILAVIQEFHPSGIGARSLQECLLLQLDRLTRNEPTRLARTIVSDHLDALAGHKFPVIARALKTDVDAVQAAAALIRALDPRPGRIFSQDVSEYVTAEVIVRKVDGQYVVVVDDNQLPHVRISAHYRRLMRDPDTAADVRTYIRERIRSGAFLIRSMHQRQKTIFRIATEIVARQQEFLEHGISQLRPMTMAEVAQRVGVHETTVSRTVANKYMQTPRGLFELKYFFTPGIQTESGNSVSNETVKDLIARMVQHEDPKAPLSDQTLQEKLDAQGIRLARRTVAKYRLMLRLPPSHLRKRY